MRKLHTQPQSCSGVRVGVPGVPRVPCAGTDLPEKPRSVHTKKFLKPNTCSRGLFPRVNSPEEQGFTRNPARPFCTQIPCNETSMVVYAALRNYLKLMLKSSTLFVDNLHTTRKMGFVKQTVHSTEAAKKLPEVAEPFLGSGCLMNISHLPGFQPAVLAQRPTRCELNLHSLFR